MKQLEIFSDIACPWCFIGKRRLEAALASMPASERPNIRWRSYQLRPDIPVGEASPARAMLEKKFGGKERFASMFAHVREVAAAEGIAFDLDGQIACNTGLAHRAIAIARTHGRESEAVELFFRAFFEQGKNLADVDTVATILIAACPSVEANTLRGELDGDLCRQDVADDLRDAAAFGVSGVPFFVLDRRVAVSGAQPPETMAAFLRG
jgi:predicted DsbA family dithiol-disulfide isomerase